MSLVSFGFTACSSDDDEGGVDESSLVGTWVWSYEVAYWGDGSTEILVDVYDSGLSETITFQSNGTGYYDDGSSFEWEIRDGYLYVYPAVAGYAHDNEKLEISVSGNKFVTTEYYNEDGDRYVNYYERVNSTADDSQVSSSSLIGTWNLYQTTATNKRTGAVTTSGASGYDEEVMTFKSNGTGLYADGFTFTWSVVEGYLIIVEEDGTRDVKTCSVSGDELIIMDEDSMNRYVERYHRN